MTDYQFEQEIYESKVEEYFSILLDHFKKIENLDDHIEYLLMSFEFYNLMSKKFYSSPLFDINIDKKLIQQGFMGFLLRAQVHIKEMPLNTKAILISKKERKIEISNVNIQKEKTDNKLKFKFLLEKT